MTVFCLVAENMVADFSPYFSSGKTYEEGVGARWKMDTPMPEGLKNLIVMNVSEEEKVASTVDFVFSAVDMTGFVWFFLYFAGAAKVNAMLLQKVFRPYWPQEDAQQAV